MISCNRYGNHFKVVNHYKKKIENNTIPFTPSMYCVYCVLMRE